MWKHGFRHGTCASSRLWSLRGGGGKWQRWRRKRTRKGTRRLPHRKICYNRIEIKKMQNYRAEDSRVSIKICPQARVHVLSWGVGKRPHFSGSIFLTHSLSWNMVTLSWFRQFDLIQLHHPSVPHQPGHKSYSRRDRGNNWEGSLKVCSHGGSNLHPQMAQ